MLLEKVFKKSENRLKSLEDEFNYINIWKEEYDQEIY